MSNINFRGCLKAFFSGLAGKTTGQDCPDSRVERKFETHGETIRLEDGQEIMLQPEKAKPAYANREPAEIFRHQDAFETLTICYRWNAVVDPGNGQYVFCPPTDDLARSKDYTDANILYEMPRTP